eukprot:g20492.t1
MMRFPSHSQDIIYSSEKERLRQRQHRIFVSLLWSDPVAKPGLRGPSKRGAGAFFDSKVTQEFLKVNKLKVLLRSHEKRQEGFSVEHANSKGHMIAATIFSASNYPKGAGEPAGNKAAVVVLEPKEPGNLANSLVSWPAWRVGFQDCVLKAQRLRGVRPQLLGYWQALDTEGNGTISKEHWATAMRAVVISDDDFPWEWLEPYMLRTHGDQFNYAVFLSQYGPLGGSDSVDVDGMNSLARKLANRFYGGSMMAILPGVKSKADIEKAWNQDGKIQVHEFLAWIAKQEPLFAETVHDGAGSIDVTLTNTSDRTRQIFTLTFSDREHVACPEGNPVSLVLNPGETLTKTVLLVQGEPFTYSWRMACRSEFTSFQDRIQSIRDAPFLGARGQRGGPRILRWLFGRKLCFTSGLSQKSET